MKIKSLFILIVLMGSFYFIYAQEKLEFVDFKDIGGKKTVYFQIKGLGDDDADRQALLAELLSDSNVESGRIFTSSSLKTRCQLFISHNVTPEYIRPILQQNGYDFEFSSVTIDGQKLVSNEPDDFTSMFFTLDDAYPLFKNTGDMDLDIETYKLEKEAWIDDNSRKYNKARNNGTAELPIVVKREDFERFTDEKKEKILSQPDIFVIE